MGISVVISIAEAKHGGRTPIVLRIIVHEYCAL